MVLRGGGRRRQVAQPEFLQPGQETLLLLTAKNPEYEFRGFVSSAPRHDGENESGKIGMIEVGDAAPFEPLRLACIVRYLHHRQPKPCFRKRMLRFVN